jgi:hypothetical protein
MMPLRSMERGTALSGSGSSPPRRRKTENDLFAAGSEIGELMCSIRWADTPLRPIESWSQTLRMIVDVLHRNRFP